MNSFILIDTEVGKASSVAQGVRGIAGVEFAEIVTGPYDLVVKAWTATEDQLVHEVEPTIRSIPGVTRTVACPMVARELVFESPTRGSMAEATP